MGIGVVMLLTWLDWRGRRTNRKDREELGTWRSRETSKCVDMGVGFGMVGIWLVNWDQGRLQRQKNKKKKG